jgi:hypothetical protein
MRSHAHANIHTMHPKAYALFTPTVQSLTDHTRAYTGSIHTKHTHARALFTSA